MIIEALIVSALVAGGGFVARKLLRRKKPAVDGASAAAASTREGGVSRSGLSVGDVVLYMGDELWLSGVADLDEEGFVLRLFRAPATAAISHVVQLDADAAQLALTRSAGPLVPPGPLPGELSLEGRTYRLKRRGSAKVALRGDAVGLSAEPCRYAQLDAPGGRTLIVFDQAQQRLSLCGEIVPRELVEVLPGSAETQPDADR